LEGSYSDHLVQMPRQIQKTASGCKQRGSKLNVSILQEKTDERRGKLTINFKYLYKEKISDMGHVSPFDKDVA